MSNPTGQRNNNLMSRYREVSSMRGIQNNQLLNNVNRTVQQPRQIRDPSKIREVILDQRKIDSKIDISKFNRIVNNMDKTQLSERERMWATRTNQPYKNILPIKDIKKEYASQDELVVYRVKKEDKDGVVFEENARNMKQAIAKHNKELTDTYSAIKKEGYAKEFEYNHIAKYNVKYDPTDYKDMKDNIVEYYKKEQQESEKDKKCVDDIIENMMMNGINDDGQTEQNEIHANTSVPETHIEEQIVPTNKYLQRQKKI
jgi:hypothetical protein